MEALEERAKKFAKPLPKGTKVTWHYRSAIGHGTIVSVAKPAMKKSKILYNIRQHDHHKGEPSIVKHYGSALTVVREELQALVQRYSETGAK